MIEKYTDPKYIQGFPNIGYDFSDDYKQGYSDGGIKELEKIKTEFEDRILLNQTVAIKIIDNHISELKGENNDIIRNTK